MSFYFVVNISAAMSIFINFYCELIVMKIQVNPITLYCVCIFSPSNELIIFVSTGCSYVKMTSYCLNPNLILGLWVDVHLQSIITLTANFSSIKVPLHYVLGFFLSSLCLCFLWSEWCFVLIFHKLFWSNQSFICFSFNRNIPSLSTIVSVPFL